MQKVTINTFITAISRRGIYYVDGKRFEPPVDAVIEKSKEPITEKECTLIAYNELPESFFVTALTSLAQCYFLEAEHRQVMDGTVLRRLRSLRDNNIINYEVVRTTHVSNGRKGIVTHYMKKSIKERAWQQKLI